MGKDKCVEWDTPPGVYCKDVRLNIAIQMKNKGKEDAILCVQAAMGLRGKIGEHHDKLFMGSNDSMVQSFIEENNSETEVP